MDLNLVRTFLEVCQTRHFGRAAEHLHLTGSAVSARIKTLEEQLGTPLFVRLHAGVEPTPTAERLITQFRSLLATWEQVRFLVAVESAPRPSLVVAASSGVWASIEPSWVRRLVQERDELMLRLETHHLPEIARQLPQGSIDVGITFEQLPGPELVSVQVGALPLTLMSDQPDRSVDALFASGYMHIDWSPLFNTRFLAAFPDYPRARVTVSSVDIAAQILADFPGAAYLSHNIVARLQPFAPLHRVPGAPAIDVPIFASYQANSTRMGEVRAVIELLQRACASSAMVRA